MSEQYSGQTIIDLMNTAGKIALRLTEGTASVGQTPSQDPDVAVPSAYPRRTGKESAQAGHPSVNSHADPD